jgi:spore coat polysaccharide biosynthesis protein SpsF (cytidylyltransferase family)
LTVDTPEDLERARELYARLSEGFRMREIRGGVG